MDTEAVEVMLYLRRNVAELRRLGSEWGMSTEEINSCIEKALENEKKLPESSVDTFTPRKIWLKFRQCMRLMFKCIGIFMVLIFAMFMVISFHEPTGNFVGKVLQPHGYTIFRMIRLATLPLHDVMNITSLYDSECLLENPFFEEPAMECDLCEGTQKVEEVQESSVMFPLVKRYCRQQRPFIYKNKAKREIGFEDLVDMYDNNKAVMETSVNYFFSSAPDVYDLPSLFKLRSTADLLEKKGLSVHWVSRNMASSQMLRKLFPRPDFVPPESEVALEKIVYIDGPQTQHFEIVGGFFQAVFVSVVKGNRKAVITPVDSCTHLCKPLHVDLDEGHILVFGPSMWKVNIMPNMEGTSIVFVGSFTIAS